MRWRLEDDSTAVNISRYQNFLVPGKVNKTREIAIFPIRKRLNGGTVPPFKMHPGGTVPPFKMHPGGTVPPFKMHPGGTVPPFKMHPGGTLSLYDIYFFILILDYRAKMNDRSLHQFCNLSLLIRSS